MRKRHLQLGALILAALGLTAFSFGGWAVITVDDLPETLTVGQPVNVAFTVRQHGAKLMERLSPAVVATEKKGPAAEVMAQATAAGPAGHYVARLIVPRAGEWAITINSGFLNNHIVLLPIPAAAAGSRPRIPDVPAEVGRRLFVAKGCVTCHVHDEGAGYQTVAVGPNLTPRRYQAEYLAKLLADPSIARTPGQQVKMPNLELKPTEIASLVAFINAERQVSAR